MHTNRRHFIKHSCAGCLSLFIPSVLSIALEGCKAINVYPAMMNAHQVIVPLSAFDLTDLQIIRVKKLDYDIALRKVKDQTFVALKMLCTHADNSLVSTGNHFVCNLHGSTFDASGRVTNGPANRSLTQLPAEVSGDRVLVNVG